MKNICIIILVLITNIYSKAQITLTSDAHTPNVSSTYNYISASSPTFKFRQDGPNQTWNFSDTTGSTMTFDYLSLSNASDPISFPLANLVESSTGGENYYANSSSELTLEGHYLALYYRIIYSDKREHLQFPFTYGDVINESYAGTVENIQASQTFNRNGLLEIKADGYGTLVLPYDTISNVLRIRSVYAYVDSMGSTFVGSYNDTIYTWYNANTNNFIASVTISYANSWLQIFAFTYLEEGAIIGISNYLDKDHTITIYPNPASTQVSIEIPVKDHSMYDIQIINNIGEVVLEKYYEYNTKMELNIEKLNPGIYFITVRNSNSIATKRIVIQ
ncbi:MAG: T9SS type A sorting domain-containing protein [Bacteroidia bacterium]|nr:T9SS type A sorting domain-containing protein [Bacteroidia bacterium]